MYEKDDWQPGETAYFEYHCLQSHDSADAPAWYHSHEPVLVLSHDAEDHDCLRSFGAEDPSYATLRGRIDAGQPCCYRVRFADGLEWTAFEDELLSDPAGFVPTLGPPPRMEVV